MILRRIFDHFIFIALDLFLAARYPREFKTLWQRTIRQGGRTISIAAPRCTNTKYVWRKLIDHDPRFTTLSDKLAVKAYVPALGINADVPKVLWTGEPKTFPEDFYTSDVVIKSNHGWNTNIFPARDALSRDAVDKGLKKAFNQRHGRRTNEWAYYNIQPRLFAEELLNDGTALIDLKIYVYGKTALRIVPIRTFEDGRRIASLWLWDGTKFARSETPSAVSPDVVDTHPLPETTQAALQIAQDIGQYFDHLRIDFLSTEQDLFLGEVTVYNLAGMETGGHATDTPSNKHWDLRRSWFLNTPQRGWRAIYARALKRFCDRQADQFPSLNLAGVLSQTDLEESLRLARPTEHQDNV